MIIYLYALTIETARAICNAENAEQDEIIYCPKIQRDFKKAPRGVEQVLMTEKFPYIKEVCKEAKVKCSVYAGSAGSAVEVAEESPAEIEETTEG